MPNWCNNGINIVGDEEKIKAIYKTVESLDKNQGLFMTLVGLPEGTDMEAYDKDGWYDINTNHWGTKWDVFADYFQADYSEGVMSVSLDTAWSPPLGFCQLLAEKYGVEVSIEFSEPGNDFAGAAEFDESGEMVTLNEYGYLEGLYHMDNDQFWDEVENLIEFGQMDDLVEESWLLKGDKETLKALIAEQKSEG
jgi:hypothetical protein